MDWRAIMEWDHANFHPGEGKIQECKICDVNSFIFPSNPFADRTVKQNPVAVRSAKEFRPRAPDTEEIIIRMAIHVATLGSELWLVEISEEDGREFLHRRLIGPNGPIQIGVSCYALVPGAFRFHVRRM